MSSRIRGAVRAALAVSCLAFFAGCVSTPPRATFTDPASASVVLHPADAASITVEPSTDVKMLPYEKERMVEEITQVLHAKQALGIAVADPRQYRIEVTITRYEKGNAFARAMLAGLGQIHIDGRVDLYAMPDHTRVSEFTLRKTFAWGGVYGASTSIEDVERSFSEGIANTLTGQDGEHDGDARAAGTD